MQNFQKLIKLPQLFLFLLGNAFVAYSYQGFVSANDFLSGGTYGMAGIVTYFLDFLPFSLVVLLFNLPCMLWAWRELDKRFVVLTTIALLLQVCFLQLFEGVVIYNNDLLLAAIFAGVFVGAGDALVLRSGSGSSGVHLIAMVLRQKFGISVSTVTTSINAVIILLSTSIFGIEKGLYTLILIFASGQTLHAILDGLSSKRTAFIITAKGEEVGEALIKGLNRGVTKLQAEGLYTHTPVSLLMCVTNMLEVGRLKTLVQSVDQQAFITFYETTDFRGHFLKHNIIVDKDEDAETAAMAPPPKRPVRLKSTPTPAPEPRANMRDDILSHISRNMPEAADNAVPEIAEPQETDAAAEPVNRSTDQPVSQPNQSASQTPSFQLTVQPDFEPEEEAAPPEEMETAAEKSETPDIVDKIRERILSRPSENGRETARHSEHAAAPGDVPRPGRRSFVPPAPPDLTHARNRSNRDFWADDNERTNKSAERK